MKLKSLKMLVKLANQKSFSKAADSLDVSQPAISMQLKSLEEKFGTDLINRQDGEIQLTPAGKLIYQNAKQILAQWEETKLQVAQIKDEVFGKLVIGASTIPANYLLPQTLADFYTQLPEVEVTVKTGDSKETIQRLTKQEVDLALVGTKPTSNQLKTEAVVDDHLILIAPANSEFAAKKRITTKDLTKMKFLIREAGSGTRKLMLKALEQTGIKEHDLNIRAHFESNEAIISAVEAGLGATFISRLAAQKATCCREIVKLDVDQISFKRKFYLAYHQQREGEELITKLTNILKEKEF